MPSTEATPGPAPTTAPRALPPAEHSTRPTLRMRIAGWRLTVADQCRQKPALSLGIALAAGFALGRLARFAFGRRSGRALRDGV